jgi:hypothetical protein
MSPLDNSRAFALIEAIYDCAIERSLWPSALERICGFTGAAGGGITLTDPVTLENRVAFGTDIDPEFLEDVSRRKIAINPMLAAYWHYEVDEVYTPAQFLGEDAFFKSRYYRELYLPYGFCDDRRDRVAAPGASSGGRAAGDGALRAPLRDLSGEMPGDDDARARHDRGGSGRCPRYQRAYGAHAFEAPVRQDRHAHPGRADAHCAQRAFAGRAQLARTAPGNRRRQRTNASVIEQQTDTPHSPLCAKILKTVVSRLGSEKSTRLESALPPIAPNSSRILNGC